MGRRVRAYYRGSDDDDEGVTADEVIEPERPDRINTGLLDTSGKPIYRQRERFPFGFVSGRS